MCVAALATVIVPGAFGAGASGVPGLTYTGVASAATGDALALSATLNDAAGAARAGQSVTFTLGNQPPVTATTSTIGFATAATQVRKAAGTYDLKVESGTQSVTVPFTVTAPNTATQVVTTQKGDGGEPSIAIGPEGNIYVSSPSSPILTRSIDGGKTWKKPSGLPFSSSGDTTLSWDQAGSLYMSNLNLTEGLQTDMYKSKTQGNAPWVKGASPLGANLGSTGQPFLTDRQWADAYIKPGGTTDTARVYLTYHDWAPNQIWINTSIDGGKNFGAPIDVIQSPLASQASFCDTIPGGTSVVKSGPHAGRVYVAWIAGDIATNVATGCNDTQMNTFHTVWIAWSDNADAQLPDVPVWNNQLVFDGGIMHDASALFSDLTLDNAGNPYVVFSMNRTEQTDTFVMASFDGGTTWNGKTDGTGEPYKVNATSGSHYFPTIAVGDPGHVDVAYLRTDQVVPRLPYGKPHPIPNMASAQWKLYFAQSLDLNLGGTPTWTTTEVTPQSMHNGDICVLGLFCEATGGDRTLLDFIDIAVDANGMAHIAYVDNGVRGGSSEETDVANQVAGPSAIG
jgi:hypothetical protein